MIDLSDTTVAKSDQLNAEDLLSAGKLITVSNVVKYSEKDFTKYIVTSTILNNGSYSYIVLQTIEIY